MTTNMKWLSIVFPLFLSGCVTQRPTAECTRIFSTMRTVFEHEDTNKDARVSRQEFQPIIDAMVEFGEREKRLRGTLFDPRQFDGDFDYRDQNHDGYWTFDESTQGVCKNGYLDRSRPLFPKG